MIYVSRQFFQIHELITNDSSLKARSEMKFIPIRNINKSCLFKRKEAILCITFIIFYNFKLMDTSQNL